MTDADAKIPDASSVDHLIDLLLAADGREQKTLLKSVIAGLLPRHLPRVAPLIRENSPRVAARITSILARHGRDDLFEQNLAGLKPGKITILRAQFARLSGRDSTQ